MPYDEEDAAYFFGRKRESDLIVANLNASRLTLLYAPSGVGKSSVLQAGVLPRLHRIAEETYEDLAIPGAAVAYVSSWRDAPLESIAAKIGAAISRVPGTGTLEQPAGTPELSIAWLRQVLRQSRVSAIYLIFDQFEEYLLYHPEDREEAGLTAELGSILNDPDLPMNVLLSIREDAVAGLDRFKDQVPRLFDNYLRLTHLSRDAAQTAIEGPLDRHNLVVPPDQRMSIEPGLTVTLLDQVRTGQLRVAAEEATPDGFAAERAGSDDREGIETPFLQLVLTRLWDEERAAGSSCLRQSTLQSLGGAEKIVQSHLDEVMDELSPAQRDVAAAVFGDLVRPSGAKIALSAKDLADRGEQPVSAVQDLLETLCAGRRRILRPLPPADGAVDHRYEIFHDVMGSAVRAWRRRYLTQRQQAESAALLIAERQVAQRAAQIARRRLRRTQLVTLSMAVMLLIVSALSYFTYLSKRDAQEQRYLSQAAATITYDPVQSLKSAVEAYKINADAPARSAVLTAALSSNSRVVAGPNPMMAGIIPTSDSGRVIAYDPHGTIWVIDDNGAEHKTKVIGALRGIVTPPVGAAAVNPDASRLVLGTDRGTVAVINTMTGRHIDIDTADGSTPAVSWVGSAANGLVLVVTGSNVAATYNPDTGKQVARFPDVVYEALPLADEQHIVTSGEDRKLRVWDARTARKIAESSTLTASPGFLKRYGQSVVGVTPNLDESSIVVWNWQAGRDPAQYPIVYYNEITGVDVDEQNQTIFIAMDKGLMRYSLVDGSLRGRLPEQANSIDYAAVSANGQWVTTAGSDGHISIWFLQSPQELPSRPTYELLSHRGSVTRVSYLGDSVVSIGVDGVVRRWQLPFVYRHMLHGNWVNDMDISHDGSLLATAGSDGHAFITDLNDNSKAFLADVSTNGALDQVRFDPTEPHRVYALGRYDTTPQQWRWGDDGKTASVQIYAKPQLSASEYLVSIAISPDGAIIAAGDTRGTIHLWDARTGKLRTDRAFQCTGQPYVTFDPSGQLLAAADQDGVRLWKLGTTDPPTLLSHPNASSVNFDPSGRRLVSMAQDFTLNVWTRDGKLDRTLVAHDKPSSNPPSFSADGDLLAVGTGEGLVQVWDVNSGVTVTLVRHHSDSIHSILFFPGDRSHLISAGADMTVAQFSCPACKDQERVIREAMEWAKTS